MIKKTSLILICVLFTNTLFSQDFWNKVEKKESSYQKNAILNRKNIPQKYSIVSLNVNSFKNYLTKTQAKNTSKIISLPNSEGKLKRFSVTETSYLAPGLAAKFPTIKSFSAQGIDDPTATAKISLGTNGVHALISSGSESTIYIDPYTKSKREYIVYKKEDLNSDKDNFTCQVEDASKEIITNAAQQRTADDGMLRTYRIAIASTGEYSQFHINRQGISSTATDNEKKAAVLSAMNTSINRVNQIYERDLGVRMIIVDNNDQIIFLDPNTDGFTNNDANALIDESQQKIDAIIGNANYDIGHTFSTGGGGLAQLNSVCFTGAKASGITGSSQPVNDPYDIDYVAHELGHQFGATHTQNNSCNRTNATAVEPGSGSTIMGYAGICSPNVQGNSDDHFHSVSIAQMWAHIQGNGNCSVPSETDNDAPIANAGNDVSIPKSTPFVLKGSATDAQGTNSLTYNWEQIDNEIATMPPVSTNTGGPTFRSLPSSTSPNRYLPLLQDVINGTSDEWVVLPSVARELNFSLTVRDNNAGGGNSDRADKKVTVVDAEPFIVTAPNSNVTWNVGSTQTITWDKGTTDQAPINCANVNIKLSVDGGQTFFSLKDNTANDGTEDIVIPNNTTTQARILIEAADNIFYNVNSTNFTISSSAPTFLVNNNTSQQTVCNTASDPVDYTLTFDFINGFNETVNLSATGLPSGATASFNPNTINNDGDVIMTIDNLNGVNQQEYTIIVEANSSSVTQTTEASLKVIGTNFTNTTLSTPSNNSNNISISPTFEWIEDTNATSYNIVVATDSNFTNIAFDETSNTNSYTHTTPLNGITTYFWRVKPINSCGEGSFSNIFEFTTETPSYCSSTFTDDAVGPEHITNVTFNTINNNSSNATVDGYEDFTSITTNIKRTETHQVSVTFDTAGFQDHCYVFIDWNQDYQFDNDTERYDLGNGTADISTVTLNITVPDNAVLGETRMRVIIEYYGSSFPHGEGACDSDHGSEWGETEDYTIVVEEEPQPDFSLVNTSDHLSICNTAINDQTFTFDYKTLAGFNEQVNFSVTGIPANATSTITPNSVTSSGAINLTLSNLNNAAVGDYTIVVTATSSSITKSINIPFNINDNICNSSGNTSSEISTTLVNFGSINNTSTKNTGYTDYTSISSEVIKGNSYNLIVNANTDGNNTVKTYAWIDWNQNCLFDANEEYDLGELTNTTGATSNSGLTIDVPTNALTGSTILRVTTKLAEDGNPNSCELDFNGETEDYTITITPTFSIENTTGGGSICNTAVNEFSYEIAYETFNDFNETVTFTTSNLPNNATATFSQPTVSNNNETIVVTLANLNNVTVGDYNFTITATSATITKDIDVVLNINNTICKSLGNTDSQISITNVSFGEIDNSSTKTTGYSDFKNLSTGVVRGEVYELNTAINNDGNSNANAYAWIDWNQNCLFDANEAYDLSANSATIEIPEDAILGTTVLRVAAKTSNFSNSCELDFDGEVEDYTINVEESFANDKTLFTDLNMYPVPLTIGEKLTVDFKVKSKDLIIIKLFDLAGNLLDSQQFSTISSKFNNQIDFPKVSTGVYLLQVENAGKIKTKKIIIQ